VSERSREMTGDKRTYYVAECMEFTRYGEYHDHIRTLKDAVKIYQNIPSERLNAVKGIGVMIDGMAYPVLNGNVIDVDLLGLFTDAYATLHDTAKELVSLLPDARLLDQEGKLSRPVQQTGALELAKKICDLQKKIDFHAYKALYPDEKHHLNKVMMEVLADGKNVFIDWLSHVTGPKRIVEEAGHLQKLLKESDISWPKGQEPVVWAAWGESTGIEAGVVFSLYEADKTFARLDQERCRGKKDGGYEGYDKTKFTVYYQIAGKGETYAGEQDFGDGEGGLLGHMEAYCRQFKTEEGKKCISRFPEELLKEMTGQMAYISKYLLPDFKYFCHLAQIEEKILAERSMAEKHPLHSETEQARCEYQEDVLKFVLESRIALTSGGELPAIPDERDYRQGKEIKTYKEQVLAEIEAEARSYGMTVDEYAENGYEPGKRKKDKIEKTR